MHARTNYCAHAHTQLITHVHAQSQACAFHEHANDSCQHNARSIENICGAASTPIRFQEACDIPLQSMLIIIILIITMPRDETLQSTLFMLITMTFAMPRDEPFLPNFLMIDWPTD